MSMINSVRCAGLSGSLPAGANSPGRNSQPVRPPPALPVPAGVNVNLSRAARSALGDNPALDAYIAAHTVNMASPEQQAATLIRRMFRDQWGQDVDPDNTFLTTFNYLDDGSGAAKPAELVRRISLTRALLSNVQEPVSSTARRQPFDHGGGPSLTLVPGLPTPDHVLRTMPALLTPLFRLAQATTPLLQWQPEVRTYEALYRGGATAHYDRSTQLDVAPQAFRAALWDMDPGTTRERYLDQFWRAHESAYPLLAKMAYVQACQWQFQEGSLSAAGHALAARVAGLQPAWQWQDLSLNDLRTGHLADPDLQTGLLDIHAYQATDIVYATDKKSQLTLLYIPGNSSPLHEFANPAAMKNWLALQARDSQKRAALLSHFTLADRPDGYTRAGVEEALQGLAAWPGVRHASGGLLSFNRATFSGYWNPQSYVNQQAAVSSDPFAAIARQQKARSYTDAALLVRSDRDVRKAEVSRVLDAAALMLVPLALLVPGAGAAVDAALLSIGAAEIGIGADDLARGKLATGQGRIAFGLLNALPVASTVVAQSLLNTGARIGKAAGDAGLGSLGAEAQLPADARAWMPQLSHPPGLVVAQKAAPLDVRLLPYVSRHGRAGLQMDAQGMYWIGQRPYAAIGDQLFRLQKESSGPGYRLLADDDLVARFNAPLLRRRADGIWEPAPMAGLRGGGDVDGAALAGTTDNADSIASFSSIVSSGSTLPIPRAPLAQAQSESTSLQAYYAGLAADADVVSASTSASTSEAAPVGSSRLRRFSYTLLPPPIRAGLSPAVMQSEARAIYDDVRALYKKGVKSSNKLHLDDAGRILEQDGVRQIDAGLKLSKLIRRPYRSADIAAAERLRAGNCDEMARSVIWRAQQQGLPARLGYIDEGGDHFFAVIGDHLPDRVRHINELSQAWIADPWAGIFAPAAEYEDRFVAKMNKWHQNNKIVCFKGDWMHANDPRWLNSVIGKFKAIEPISYRPVMSRARPSTSSRSAGSCMESLC